MTAANEKDSADAYRCLLRRRRRAICRMVGGLVAGLLLVLSWVIYTDAPSPDVADLVVERESIPDAENFFVQLGKLGESLPKGGLVPNSEPEDLPAGSPDKVPDNYRSSVSYTGFRDFLADGHGWTPSRLAKWDAPLARLVEDCTALMRLERCLAPAPRRTGHWEDANPFYELEEHLSVAAGMYRNAGDHRLAVEVFLLLHRIGERVKRSRGGLLAYEWGQGMQRQALAYLAELAAADPLAAEMIAAGWRREDAIEDRAAFHEALRMEYAVFSNWLDVVAAARGHDYGQPDVICWLQKTRVLYPLVLKRNLTKGLYADYIRREIEWSELTETEYMARGGYMFLKLEFRDFFRPVNLYGRMVAWSHSTPLAARFHRLEYRAAVSAFEALVATRRYHADHGTLPDTLDALVPCYLPAVPVDYFDGAPIRYSREYRAVWSVGRGGLQVSSLDQQMGNWEIYQRLDFAKPPTPVPESVP